MEERCRLEVVGITYSQIESGVYAVILKEAEGNRRIPIVVGTSEAQSIECKLQSIKPPRPLSHDLFINCISQFDIEILEIFIKRLPNGVFAADIVFQSGERRVVVDARSSDAIAIALRCDAPIFTSDELLEEIGVSRDSAPPHLRRSSSVEPKTPYSGKSLDQLRKMLDMAVEEEKYEEASKIKEEIDKRTGETDK